VSGSKRRKKSRQKAPIVESVGSGAKILENQGDPNNQRPSLLLILIKFGTPIGMLLFAIGTVFQILKP